VCLVPAFFLMFVYVCLCAFSLCLLGCVCCLVLLFAVASLAARQMATKWGMPHCSISELCLHPTIRALQFALLQQDETKCVRWPKTEAQQVLVMDRFMNAYELPGCLGAIDGSLIPQRKPTKAQANQDADSYYGYKGGIASLLLAVCDEAMPPLYP
jgi:hypothetical protein